MNEKWPFTNQTIPTPGHFGNTSTNPMPSMPAEQFGRGIDPPSGDGDAPGGGDSFDGDWPLKLVAVDTENVKVLLGTVSGFTPTDIETPIDVSGTDATWAIYMHATLSGTSVTAVEVESSKTNSVPSDDATNSYRKIGEVDVASSVITAVRPSMAWSQTVAVCVADTPPYYWVTGA